MKYLIILCLIFSLATFAWTSSASWGRRYAGDYLLSQQNVVRRPVNGNYQSAYVNFPESGQTNNKNITYIQVLDRFTNTSGAQPSLWSGGPGYRFASIYLRSQYSKGINSTAYIYGR